MATNTYKCTVCKRQVERVENVYGLDVLGKCIITNGCLGKLRRVGRNLDNIRESFPKFESNITDYNPRNYFYPHIQTIPSSSWTVKHGLNCDPSVSVFVTDENGKYVPLPNTEYTYIVVDRNTSKISFRSAISGVAQFTSRSSTGISTARPVISSGTTQVTTFGSFVFALPKLITKDASGNAISHDLNDYVGDIKIETIIERPNEEELFCSEKLIGMFDSTPWTGIDEVLVGKRKNYYLKTKNILNFQSFNNPDITFADIPEGTRLRFTRIDYGSGVFQPIESRNLLLLLSRSPYSFTDKIRNKVLDLGEYFATGKYLTYSNGEFFVDSEYVENTYPPIEAAKRIGPIPPIPSPSPTPSITPTISITPTLSLTPSVTISPTPTPTPTVSITASITPSITPSPTPTPSITASVSITPTPSITMTPTPSVSITASITPTVSVTPTPSTSPPAIPSPTPTESITPTPTESVTPTPTETPTPTPSVTISPPAGGSNNLLTEDGEVILTEDGETLNLD